MLQNHHRHLRYRPLNWCSVKWHQSRNRPIWKTLYPPSKRNEWSSDNRDNMFHLRQKNRTQTRRKPTFSLSEPEDHLQWLKHWHTIKTYQGRRPGAQLCSDSISMPRHGINNDETFYFFLILQWTDCMLSWDEDLLESKVFQ